MHQQPSVCILGTSVTVARCTVPCLNTQHACLQRASEAVATSVALPAAQPQAGSMPAVTHVVIHNVPSSATIVTRATRSSSSSSSSSAVLAASGSSSVVSSSEQVRFQCSQARRAADVRARHDCLLRMVVEHWIPPSSLNACLCRTVH